MKWVPSEVAWYRSVLWAEDHSRELGALRRSVMSVDKLPAPLCDRLEQLPALRMSLRLEAENVPPIIIEHYARGRYVIVDGNHRLAAARAIGLKRVPVLRMMQPWRAIVDEAWWHRKPGR